MANLLNTGNGAVKSTSLEAAFVEIVQLAQNFEDAAIAAGTLVTNNIALDFLTGQKLTTITATLPVSFQQGPGAVVTLTATDYFSAIPAYALPDLTGPAISSVSYPAAVFELSAMIQALETTENRVTSSFNFDTNTVTIAAQLPTVFSVGPTGDIVATVTPYLP